MIFIGRFALLSCATIALSHSAYAEPAVTASTFVAEPRLEETHSMADLAGHIGQTHLPANAFVGGYFDGPVQRFITIDTHLNGQQLEIQQASLKIEITSPRVFLGRDLPNDCLRRESLQHELQHYAYRQQILPTYKARFENAVQGVMRQYHGTDVGADSQSLTENLYAAAYAALDREIAAFYAEMTKLDAIIDNSESYLQTSARCR